MFTNTLKLLPLVLLLGACVSAESEPPRSEPLSAQRGVAADTGRVDLSAVAPGLRRCVPETAINHEPTLGERVTFYTVGSVEAPDGSEKILLSHFGESPGSTVMFEPVVLNVTPSGVCTPTPDTRVREEARTLLEANPELRRRDLAIRIDVAGGPVAYADAYRGPGGGREFRECGPGDSPRLTGCLSAGDAAVHRELGVEVADENAPTPNDMGVAGLSPNLQSCVPPAVLDRADSITEAARTQSDGSEYVLLEWTESSPGAPNPNSVLLRVRGETCTSLLPQGGDLAVRDVVSASVAEALADKRLDTHIRRAGGVDAYAEQLRAEYGGRLAECTGPREEWSSCLAPALASKLRARGATVSQ